MTGSYADWQRPPFEPGHTLSLVHGARSPRSIAERAAAVHEELLEHLPWCADPRFAVSVNRYAQATAREALAHDALMAGRVNPRLLEAATAAARLAWRMGDELGLTPAGHARLRLLAAGAVEAEASLQDLAAAGREAMRQRSIDSTAVDE